MKYIRATITLNDADDSCLAIPATRGGLLFEYLNLFSRVYSRYANAALAGQLQMAINESPKSAGARAVKSVPVNFEQLQAVEFTVDNEGQSNELLIEKLNKNSPLEMVLVGIPIALTAAVIFSGGTVKINRKEGFEFELPPIGEGLKKIREALEKAEVNQHGRKP